MNQDASTSSVRECMSVRARIQRVYSDRQVDLAILPGPRCSGCEGACLWGWSPPTSLRISDENCHRPGDLVSVSLRTRQVLRAAMLVHGLPWAGLLAGAAVGVVMLGGDLGSLLGAAVGVGAGLLAGQRLQRNWRVSPELIKVSNP